MSHIKGIMEKFEEAAKPYVPDIYGFLKNSFYTFANLMKAGVARQALNDITSGVTFEREIIDAMRTKGWKIEEKGLVSDELFSTHNLRNDILSPTNIKYIMNYTATMDGQEKGSLAWYRDLCDVLGFDRNIIPENVVNQDRKFDDLSPS